MNKVVLMGRLTRDPEVRYSQGEPATAVARYTLAVERRFQREGAQTADFIPCVVFGNPQNLPRNISVRDYGFRFPEGSRPAVIRIKMGSRFIPQKW